MIQISGSKPEDPSELQNLANSLVASEEAMGVLGSALAGHVVGALQAQGLVSTQSGGQPTSFTPLMPAQGWVLAVCPPIFSPIT